MKEIRIYTVETVSEGKILSELMQKLAKTQAENEILKEKCDFLEEMVGLTIEFLEEDDDEDWT